LGVKKGLRFELADGRMMILADCENQIDIDNWCARKQSLEKRETDIVD
jgi:hypothetical protein